DGPAPAMPAPILRALMEGLWAAIAEECGVDPRERGAVLPG
ncbi:MAG: class IV aminotransferase, partial [Aurantimonas sp.]|nr:class IV aminotransferase [Aurantimonas sp.]